MLDGVFNHVGRGFWAFRDVQEKKWDSPYKDWFHIKVAVKSRVEQNCVRPNGFDMVHPVQQAQDPGLGVSVVFLRRAALALLPQRSVPGLYPLCQEKRFAPGHPPRPAPLLCHRTT